MQARVQPALEELQTQNEALYSEIDDYKEKIKGLQRQVLIGADNPVEKPKAQVRKKQMGMRTDNDKRILLSDSEVEKTNLVSGINATAAVAPHSCQNSEDDLYGGCILQRPQYLLQRTRRNAL